MVAVVSGNGLGLTTSSLAKLGGNGLAGNAANGRSGEQVYVNTTTGNLVVQENDETLFGTGSVLSLVRTYNSQGQLNDGEGYGWQLSPQQSLVSLSGTVNTAGSTITRIFGDGAEVVYTYDTTQSVYVNSDNAGAADTLAFNSSTSEWTWTDGSARNTETYNVDGQLLSSQDTAGNTTTYGYTGRLLTQITDASGQSTYLDYSGGNLADIRVVSNGATQTRTQYAYDSRNRLSTVTVDLSPTDTYVTNYTYDGTSDRIATITQTDGSTVSFTYEQVGNAYRVKTYATSAQGPVNTLTYSDENATPPASSQTAQWFQATSLGNLSPDSGDAKTAFDAHGDMVEIWSDGNQLQASQYSNGSGWSDWVTLNTLDTTVYKPSLSVDESGNAVIAWVQNDGNVDGVFVSTYNFSANTWSAPTRLSSTGSSVLTAGGLTTAIYGSQMAVSWQQDGQLYVSSLAPYASTWSTPAAVNGTASATGYNSVSLAMSGDGSLRTMWTQSDGTWVHPYMNAGTFDSAAGAYQWGSAVELESDASNTPSAQMAFDAAGNGVAVWNAGGQLQSSTYDASSGTWSAPTVLDSGLSAAIADSNTLSLSMDRTSGDAILSWVRDNGTVAALYVSRFSGTTHTWDATPTQLESSSQPVGSSGGKVMTTAISGSQAAIVWSQLDANGLDYDLYASRWTGSSWEAPEQLAGLVDGMGVRDPAVTVDRQGNIDVLWKQPIADGSAMTIYDAGYEVQGPWGEPSLMGQGDAQTTAPQIGFDRNGDFFGAVSDDSSLITIYPSWLQLSTLTSTVYAPSLSVDESGNAVIAWVQNDGNVDAVFVSTYNSAAGTWSAPVELSSTSSSVWSGGAVSTAISGSQMAVSWEQDGQLYVASLAPNESTWSTPVAVNGTASATNYNSVSLAISGDGSIRALWTQSDGTWFHPYMNARTLDSATGAYQWGSAAELESDASDTPSAQMAFDAAGNGVAVWNAGGQLQSSTYDVSSGAWSAPTVLDSGLSTVIADSNTLSLSMDRASGDAIVSWVRDNGTVPTIYVSRFSGTTHTWDAAPTQLENSSEPVGNSSGKALATGIDRGLAAVVWTQLDPNGLDYDLYASRWTGSSWGAPEQIGGQIDGMGVRNPVVAVGPNAGINVMWSQYTPDGFAQNVYLDLFRDGSNTGSQNVQTDVTDALGQVTTYVHDSAGRLVSILSPVSNGTRLETDYTYDAAGNLASIVVDPQYLNRVTSFTYDTHGNLLTRTDADNNTVTRTYSADNQLLTETELAAPAPGQTPVALTTRYVYDTEDHLRFVVSADGRVEEYRYNAAGQRVADIKYAAALYDVSGLDAATAPTLAQLTGWVGAQSAQSLSATERVDYTYDFRGLLATATAYATVDSTGAGVASTAATTQYVYDQRGHLLQQIDPRGSASATDPANPNLPYATTYTYDGLGRVLTTTQWIADGSTQTTTTQYDDANRRTITTYANGLVSTSLYDRTGVLLSVTRTGPSSQALGTTAYTYDADNQLRMVTDADGVRSYLLYDALGRKVADIDGTGALTAYVYDTTGEVVKTTRYADALSAGQLASLTDAQGAPTAVSLDDLLVALPDTVGRAQDEITRTVYDAAGLKAYSIDAAGAVTQYVYDGAGRLTDEVQYATTVNIDPSVNELPVGGFTFAPGESAESGLRASPDDRHVRYFYDADGHLVGTLDAAGYLTESIYDAAGRLSERIAYATVSPSASWATGTLDALRPTAAALDEITHYFYDDAGRQVGVLDAGGYLTANQYDASGQLEQSARYDQVLAWSAGASVDSLEAQLQAGTVSHSTSYQYDGAGQLTQQTHYEGTIDAYQYDAAGNRTSTDQAQGTSDERLTQTRYDALGRVIAQLTAQGSAQIAAGMSVDTAWSQYAVHNTYDNDGRQVSSTDQNGLTTYTYYDSDGRVRFTVDGYGRVSESRYNTLGQLTDTITYEGRIATSGLTGGLVDSTITTAVQGIADPTQDGHTSYTYDLAGDVASSVTADGASVTHIYNAFGEEQHRAEQIDDTQVLTHDYTYDTRGLLEHTVSDAGGVNATEDRGYDAFGQLTSVTDADGHTTITGYDTLGRVMSEEDALTNERTLTYDAFSRLKSETDYTNLASNATTYTYNDAQRSVTVTSPEGVAVTTVYNREGQTASVVDALDTKNYQYDANGRLEQVSDTSAQLGTNILEAHTYDAGGRAITDVDANGTVTSYTYDPANPTVTRNVDPTGQALVTSDQYDGQGRLTHEVDANGRVTDTTYYRNGAVKSVTVQVGVSAGNPTGVEETDYTYDAMGHVLTKTEGVGSLNPRRTLYAYDALGRETSETVDPTSLGGTLNLVTQYKYDAAGNLTRKIDAAGNSTWYVYDADNHLRYTINTLDAQTLQGAVTEQTYDVNGRVIGTRRYATAIPVSSFGDQVSASQLSGLSAQPGVDQYTQSVYDRDGREVYTLREVIQDPAAAVVQELVTQKLYDARGNVTCQIAYAKAIAQGTYGSQGSVQSALDAAGNIAGTATTSDHIQWTVYDARNRVAFTVDANKAVVSNTYDDAGHITSTTAFATSYNGSAYDLTSLTSWAATHAAAATDRTTRYWYDSTGRQRFVLDPLGYLQETRYLDSARQKIEVQYATAPASVEASVPANATTADVAAIARALPASDPNNTSSLNETTTYQYDTVGQLRQMTQVLGSSSVSESYDYDAVGNKYSYTNKDNQTWYYQYDANHRLILETAPAVDVTTVDPSLTLSEPVSTPLETAYQYDSLGNLTARTEAYGTTQARTTSYDYDALGRQTGVHYPQVGVYTGGDNILTAGSAVTRTETAENLYTQTQYDALGNEVVNRDIGGNYSYRTYDALGRLQYEVDADQDVTYHGYDAFGNETQVTRYANPLNSSGLTAGAPLTSATVAGKLSPVSSDRTITKQYDALDRLTQVVQPAVTTYIPGASETAPGTPVVSAPTTRNVYDAFGDLIEQRTLASTDGQTWASTCYYYDRDGRQVAQVNAGGYVTVQHFDAMGNLTQHIEYATAVPNWSPGDTPPALPSVQQATAGGANSSVGYDRETDYAYDQLNRKIRETLVLLQYDSPTAGSGAATGNPGFQDQVTTYQYDGVGNVVAKSVGGLTTTTYYDALGRMVGQAGVARDPGTGVAVSPYTSYAYDAFGNQVGQTEYATGLTSVSPGTKPTPTSVPGSDRTTVTQYDALGRVIAVMDPTGAIRNTSYSQRGDVAKTWQIVLNPNDDSVDALVSIYTYDAVGRQIEVETPSTTTSLSGTSSPNSITGSVKVKMTYNSFGEMLDKSTTQYDTSNNIFATQANGDEYFDYDNDGRLWRTNQDGGVNEVYLYDLQGRATAVIKSQSLDLKGNSAFTDPQSTAMQLLGTLMGQTMRTETVYDTLGRVLAQHNITFTADALQDAITTPISFGNATIQGSSRPVLYWAAPAAAGLSMLFQYRAAGSSGPWTTLQVGSVGGSQIGVDLSSVPGLTGNFTYQLSYIRSGDSTAFATATGTFSLNTTTNYTVGSVSSAALGGVSTNPFADIDLAHPSAPFTGFAWSVGDGSNSATLELHGPNGSVQTYNASSVALPNGRVFYQVNFGAAQPAGTYTYYLKESTNGTVTNIGYGTLVVTAPVANVSATPNTPWVTVSAITASTSSVTATATFTWPLNGDANAAIQYRVHGSSTWSDQVWTTTFSNATVALPGLSAGVQYDYLITNYRIGNYGGITRFMYTVGTAQGTFTLSGNSVSLADQAVTGDLALGSVSAAASNPIVGNTQLVWTGPSTASMQNLACELDYGPVGGSMTTVYLDTSSSAYAVNLANLPTGTNYTYNIQYYVPYTYLGNPERLFYSGASGQFQVTAAGTASVLSQQDSTGQTGTAQFLTGVSSSGNSLVWTHSASATDTVSVSYTDTTTGVSGTATATSSDYDHYSFSLQGLAADTYNYSVQYYHSGSSSPYLVGTGQLTVSYPVQPNSDNPTSVSTLAGIGDGGNGRLQWSPAASAGDVVSFQYIPQGGSSWISLPPVATGTGYYVDVTGLAGTTIQYKVTYTHPGYSTPYLYTTGQATIVATRVTTGSAASTTALSGQLATPTLAQTVDRWGDSLSVTDANQQTTKYAYNQRGQLTDTIQPLTLLENTSGGTRNEITGSPQQHNYYDIFGRLIGTSDGLNTNTVTLNAAGQTLSEKHADGNIKSYVYDVFGDLLQTTDELGYRTRDTYDLDGRLTTSAQEINTGAFTDQNPASLAALAQNIVLRAYTYDGAGRRTSETSGEFDSTTGAADTTRYWYDLQGNVVVRRDPLGDATSHNTTYQYDSGGHLIEETNQIDDTQTWSYDSFGHIQSHTDMAGTTYQYVYNYDGLLVQQTSTVLDKNNAAQNAQNIQYTYDAAGDLLDVSENSASVVIDQAGDTLQGVQRDTHYTYDTAGRQVRAKVTVNGVVYQDTTTTYDALGRVIQLSDPRYRTSYSYDAQGNRTHVETYYYDDQAGVARTQDLWYTYDSMNRVLISQGSLDGSTISTATQGITLTYDAKGERQSASDIDNTLLVTFNPSNAYYNEPVYGYAYQPGQRTEHYTYDGLGRLLTTTLDAKQQTIDHQGNVLSTDSISELLSSRSYDHASRLLSESDLIIADGASSLPIRTETSTYDDDGTLLLQTTSQNNTPEFAMEFGESMQYTDPPDFEWVYFNHSYTYTPPTGSPNWTMGYDAAGNLRGYTLVVYDPNNSTPYTVEYQSTNTFKLRPGDSYQEMQQYVSSTANGPESGTTTYTYDVDGGLEQFVDTRDGTKDRFFVNDGKGQVIEEIQGQYDGQSGRATAAAQLSTVLNDLIDGTANNNPAQFYFYANGQEAGSFENTGSGFNVHFDQNYTPVSTNYPTATPPQVVVQQGDTLRTIAARLYGDGSLWYLIAQDNGLSNADDVQPTGTVLTIPNRVVSLANRSGSLKPYDPAQALGDTTPTQPVPPPQSGGGCGAFGQILVLVVAIVVTIYTAGAAAEALGATAGGAGGAFSTGIGVLTGSASVTAGAGTIAGTIGLTATGVVAGAVGAAVGSVVSQGVGIAIGEQSSFNWKAVASAALAGGAGAGFAESGVFGAAGAQTDAQLALEAAVNSGVNQGVNVALGLQKSFSWEAVAASAIAAPVARYLGQKAGGAVGTELDSPLAGTFAQQITAGEVNQIAYSAFAGGKLNFAQITADAFGNALGNSIVQSTQPTPQPTADDLQEVHVTAQRISANGSWDLPTNNPTPVVSASAPTPDEARDAASMAEVVVTGHPIAPGTSVALDLFANVMSATREGNTGNWVRDSAVNSLGDLAETAYRLQQQGIQAGASLRQAVADEVAYATGQPVAGREALSELDQEALAASGPQVSRSPVTDELAGYLKPIGDAISRFHSAFDISALEEGRNYTVNAQLSLLQRLDPNDHSYGAEFIRANAYQAMGNALAAPTNGLDIGLQAAALLPFGLAGTGERVAAEAELAGIGNVGSAGAAEGEALDDAGQVLTPGSNLHKATRWQEYQANGGTWSYDRWSNVYDANMTRASAANEAVDAYHQTLGWGQREVTVDASVDGVDYARRLDIADVATQRGIEYKTGYQSATQDNLWEVARDTSLVDNGWDIHWVFRDTASQPLLDALTRAGIRHTVGQ